MGQEGRTRLADGRMRKGWERKMEGSRVMLCPEGIGSLGRGRFKRSQDKSVIWWRHPQEGVSVLSARSIYILKGGWRWGRHIPQNESLTRGFWAAEEGCLELSSISLVISLTSSVTVSLPDFEAHRGSPGFQDNIQPPTSLWSRLQPFLSTPPRLWSPPTPWPGSSLIEASPRSFPVLKPPRVDPPL